MLEYDRIDILEEIDINKTRESRECYICHYCYLLDQNLKYEVYLRNGCHDLMQKTINFENVAIVSVKGRDCRIHFCYMSKNGAINLNKKSKPL